MESLTSNSNRSHQIQIAHVKFKSLTSNSNRSHQIQIAHIKFKSLTSNSNSQLRSVTSNSNLELRSVTQALVSITPSYRQLMRSRRVETAVLPDLQGYEPPTKRRTINSLKPYNIANKSNSGHNVKLNEQSSNTVHRLARELLHLQFQNEKTGRTENDEIDARNVRTSLLDRPIALHKESYSYLWLSRTKINMTSVIKSKRGRCLKIYKFEQNLQSGYYTWIGVV